MRRFVIMCALLVTGAASADQLADANKLMETKAYPQALALYTQLAQQGNAEAQFHLGEMYWYGEAGKVDLTTAQAWFRKAAAAGSKPANAALADMGAREVRAKEIAYWATEYQGADLIDAKRQCEDPQIPSVSKDNAAIKQVNLRYKQWHACYGDQVARLQLFVAPEKRIPADLSALMNQQEYEQAVSRVGQVYARVIGDAGARAQAVLAAHAAWTRATERYVEEETRLAKLEAERSSQRRVEVMREVRVGPPPVVRK